LEDVRRHSNIELVTSDKRLMKLAASPRFKRFEIFNENLVGVDSMKKSVMLSKPIYAGFSVQDIIAKI